MKKSPVAGISGSIRAECLSKADLTAAEKHGKRLDMTSQARAVSKDPPVTTTGLDLWKLYRKHVSDAFVPKCKTVAKHIIIQFPKDLVDGEDPRYMLYHARGIVETIFGDKSIFADRVDRDEKGRHIVDIFVAPKYTKVTKKASKLAVSVTVHEEALADKHERTNSNYGRGQAMQDAVFAYFRDEMRLPGVQRGNPKTNPGPDWKNAEQLREEELDAREEDIKRREAEVAEAIVTAQRVTAKAEADSEAARAKVAKAEAVLADAIAISGSARADREELVQERCLQQAQLALLERAADDENGMDLRRTETGFSMKTGRLTEEEKATYRSPWPNAIIRMARMLASALEQARELIEKVRGREKQAEAREADIDRKERQIAADRRQHEEAVQLHKAALADIAARLELVASKEERLGRSIANAQRAVADAQDDQRAADAARRTQDAWVTAIHAIAPSQGRATIGKGGRVLVARALADKLPKPVLLTLRDPAPDWAKSVVTQGRTIAKLHKKAVTVDQQNHEKSKALDATMVRVVQSRQVLEDIVTGKCGATGRDSILTLHYGRGTPLEQVKEIPFANLEKETLRVAELYAHFTTMTARIVDLEEDLGRERAALAQAQPSRAPEMQQKQERTATKVSDTFNPPPGWHEGFGR